MQLGIDYDINDPIETPYCPEFTCKHCNFTIKPQNSEFGISFAKNVLKAHFKKEHTIIQDLEVKK